MNLFILSLVLTVQLCLGQLTPCPFSEQCGCFSNDPTEPFNFFVRCDDLTAMPTFTPEPNGQKYTAQVMSLTGEGLHKLSARHFAAFEEIQFLQFDQKKPTAVDWDKDAFDGVEVSGLWVNGIGGMIPPPEAVQKLGANGLETFYAINNSVNTPVQVDQNAFKDFKDLVILWIEGYRFQSIHPNAFSSMQNLAFLFLHKAGLTEIPEAVSKLSYLMYLSLANNEITDIRPDTFSSNTNLLYLYLEGNKLAGAIERSALDSLPSSLTFLGLANVGLSAVPVKLLQKLTQLTSLDMRFNSIQKVTKQDLSSVSRLSQLHLDGNPLSSIDDDLLSTLQHMMFVLMGNTSLSMLDMSFFTKYQSPYNSYHIIVLDNTQNLEALTLSNLADQASSFNLQLINTGLKTIDSKVGDFMTQDGNQGNINMMNNKNLLCGTLNWMVNVVCPDKIIIDGSQCADKNNLPLDAYLRSVSPSSKCRNQTPNTPVKKLPQLLAAQSQLSEFKNDPRMFVRQLNNLNKKA